MSPPPRPRAAIVGIAGPTLAPDEAALLREYPPAGVILFARNIADPAQLAALSAQLRGVMGAEAVVMIDQEGGRVARLRPPHWRPHPSAQSIGALPPDRAGRAAYLSGALIGAECAQGGIDVVCAPVLDVSHDGTTDAIGDRAFSREPAVAARLGRCFAEGLRAAGVQAVGKHAPGHGRAQVDSHHELPIVEASDLSDDIAPFAANADLPWLMTAHVVYRALDADVPATLSPIVIEDVIRGRIGFTGVLCSDDLAMHALAGDPAERAQRALAAGCDIALYCPGDAAGTAAVLHAVPALSPHAAERLAAAAAWAREGRTALDPEALSGERTDLMA